MSEHIGPGFDSGAFKDDEAKTRKRVEDLERERREQKDADRNAHGYHTKKKDAKKKK